MISEKDLRIGNWVKHLDHYLQVTLINPYMICSNNWGFDDFSRIEGIPLSPEILYKAGFKGNSYGNFSIKIAEFAYLRISFKDYSCAQICETVTVADHDLDAPCKYLHQLQNLFYALNDTELIINL